MNYSQLKTLLLTENDRLTLRDSDFSDSGIEKLFQDFFDGQALALEAVVVTANDTDEEVKVEGHLTNSILSITSLRETIDLLATFFVFNDEAQAHIILTFREAWTLTDVLQSQAFSQLAQDLSSVIGERLRFPLSEIALDSAFQSMKLSIKPDLSLSLDELPSLLQGVPVAQNFPTVDFPSFDTGLILNSFEIASRIEPMVVTFLAMEVAQSEQATWEPVGDLLKFKDFRAQFLLMNPLAHSVVSIELQTTVEVAGTNLIGQISLPTLEFQCHLAAGDVINLKPVFEEILDIPIPVPELRCTTLEILGDPELDTFEFQATFTTELEILPNLRLTEISGHFILTTQPIQETSGTLNGLIQFGQTVFQVSAVNFPGATGWQFSGGNQPGNPVIVSTFVDDLLLTFGIDGGSAVSDVKEILGDLTITQLDVSFHTQTRDFSFACLMAFSLDDRPAALLLNINLTNTTSGHTLAFAGLFTVGVRQFNLSFESSSQASTSTTSLVAAYGNPDGEEIDLIAGLVDLVSSNSPLDFPDPDLNLTTLTLYRLQLSFDREKMGATVSTRYRIQGEFDWTPQFNLDGDTISPFKVRAQVDLIKQKVPNAKVLGHVSGEIESQIDGLEFLSLGVGYELKARPDPNELRLQLTIGQIAFSAFYTNTNGTIHLEFSADTDGVLTLGDVMTFITSLVDPSIEEFVFDPPWDFVTRFDLAPLLRSLTVDVDLTRNPKQKKIGIVLNDLSGLVPSELSTFLTVTSLNSSDSFSEG